MTSGSDAAEASAAKIGARGAIRSREPAGGGASAAATAAAPMPPPPAARASGGARPASAVGHHSLAAGTGRSTISSFRPSPTLTTVRSPTALVAGLRTHIR